MLLSRAVKGFIVKLSENGQSPQVQVLRVGKFKHPVYGDFQITPQVLAEMKTNFDAGVRGIDIALDYFHESDKEASGWIKGLELKENGTELWAFVEWTPAAQEKIRNKELKYFSPDFAFQWSDPETDRTFSNVLFGGGLTNRPFVKEMAAIAAQEKTKGKIEMEKELKEKIEALELENKKLSEQVAEDQKKLAALPNPEEASEVEQLKKQIIDLQAQLEKAKADSAIMAEKIKCADEAKQMAEKEAAFTVLLTEGKACAAQKDAFIKGDMNEFIKLAQPVNLKGNGTTTTEGGDREEKILKLADEKQKANPKLTRGEAISIAINEIK